MPNNPLNSNNSRIILIKSYFYGLKNSPKNNLGIVLQTGPIYWCHKLHQCPMPTNEQRFPKSNLRAQILEFAPSNFEYLHLTVPREILFLPSYKTTGAQTPINDRTARRCTLYASKMKSICKISIPRNPCSPIRLVWFCNKTCDVFREKKSRMHEILNEIYLQSCFRMKSIYKIVLEMDVTFRNKSNNDN